MLNLPGDTWLRFVAWMALGFVLYFAYSRRNSRLAAGGDHDPATAADRERARGHR
jgi:APA family basic amino acid/polyamine antiporter